MNLSTRILVPVLAALLISVGGLTGFSVWSQYQLIDTQEKDRLGDLGSVFSDRLQMQADLGRRIGCVDRGRPTHPGCLRRA